MIYCFDLDDTLCETIDGEYESSVPYLNRITKVNELYDDGHHIIVDTARGSISGINWFHHTHDQLIEWGLKFHELRVGTKTYADYYIDDKAINDYYFFHDE